MMETERRPTIPSRYKSLRRKTTSAATPPPIPQVPVPAVPQIPGQTYIPIQQAQKLAQLSQLPRPVETQSPAQQLPRQPTLVERASPAKIPAPAPEAQHEHASRFRKMLRLRTKTLDVGPHHQHQHQQESQSPSPSASPHTSRRLFKQRDEEPRREPSPEEKERQRARDNAVAALEGKRPSRPSSKTRTPIESTPTPKTPAYDMSIPLHFDGKPTVQFPIMKTMTAGALLEKVRPGHTRYLVELWPSIGLERPVRYFEQVSDVASTWDVGTSSHVRISKSAWGVSRRKLEDFPKTEPQSGESVLYYYVTADRKWVKRSVTIDGGNLRILKKDRPQDKDYCQTVSMEYFDIYTFSDPYGRDRSRLRSPAKYCFALKSQHKQSLFGKNSVFVHYFALDDEALFIQWHGMIRDVKTRLLAEKMGIAPWEKPPASQAQEHPSSSSRPSSSHRPQKPKPLLSPEELAQPPQANIPRSKSLSRNKSVKQTITGRSRAASAKMPQPSGLIAPDPAVFSPGGLLGADYEAKRREALKNYKADQGHDHIPPVPPIPISRNITPRSPQQLASGGHSIHSNDDVAPLSRSASRPGTAHGQSQTLISFSPLETMPSLPHQRRGRGHTVSQDPTHQGVGLVNHATSFRPGDEPIHPPTSLHRWNTTGKPPSSSHSNHNEEITGFTGTGLLANSHLHFAGAKKFGHGVKTGMDAIGENGQITPLVDVRQKGMFAPGSLLEQRERQAGQRGPTIDREEEERERERERLRRGGYEV